MAIYRYNVVIDIDMKTSGVAGGKGQVAGAFKQLEQEADTVGKQITSKMHGVYDALGTARNKHYDEELNRHHRNQAAILKATEAHGRDVEKIQDTLHRARIRRDDEIMAREQRNAQATSKWANAVIGDVNKATVAGKTQAARVSAWADNEIKTAQANINKIVGGQNFTDAERKIKQVTAATNEGVKASGMWANAFKGAFIGAVAGMTFSTVISGITGITSAIWDAAKAAVQLAGDFQMTRNAMTLFMGSTQAADAQLATLQRLSENTPGLRLEDAQVGATRLQALGFQAKIANDLIVGLAKQKLVSGVTDEGAMNRVIVNLQQLQAGSPQIMRDIRQMVLAIPSLSREIDIAFGSIEKFRDALKSDPTSAMEKFAKSLANARVPAAGFNDAFGKLIDQFQIAGRTFGEPILDPLIAQFKDLNMALKDNKSVWADWGQYVADIIRGISVFAKSFTSDPNLPETPDAQKPWLQKLTGQNDKDYRANFDLWKWNPLTLSIGTIGQGLNILGKQDRLANPPATNWFGLPIGTKLPQTYKPPPKDPDSTGGSSSSRPTVAKGGEAAMRRFFEEDLGFNVNRTFGRAINAGSMHPLGKAIDVAHQGIEQGELVRRIALAIEKGYQFVDERVKRPGIKQTGPHLHFEKDPNDPSLFLGADAYGGAKNLAYLKAIDAKRLGKGGGSAGDLTQDVSRVLSEQSDILTKNAQDGLIRSAMVLWKNLGLIPDDKIVAKFKEILVQDARSEGVIQPSDSDIVSAFTMNAATRRQGVAGITGQVSGNISLRRTPDEQYLANIREGLSMDERREQLVLRERNLQGEISIAVENQWLARKEAFVQNQLDFALLQKRNLAEEANLEFEQSKTDLLARQQDIHKQLAILASQNADKDFVAQRRATLASGEEAFLKGDITLLEDRLANGNINATLEIRRNYLEDIVRLREREVLAVSSLNRSQMEMADKLIYSKNRADANVAEFFANQKGITEIISDTKINAITTAYTQLENVVGRLTAKMGAWGDVVKELVVNLVKLAINPFLQRLMGVGTNQAGGAAIPGIGGGQGGGGFSLGNMFGGGLFGGGGGIGPGGTPMFNPNGGFGGMAGAGAAIAGGSVGFGLGQPGRGMTSDGGGLLGQASPAGGGLVSGLFGGMKLTPALAAMLPALGAGVGGMVGGGKGVSGALGSVGGLLLGGAGAVGLMGGAGAAVFGTGGALAGLGGAAAFLTNPFTIAAGVAILIGAYFLNRNQKRRQEEKIRDAAMVEALTGLDKLIDGVKSDRIDGLSALESADQIRKTYMDSMGQLKDSKTRRIALADVSRLDSKINLLKSAVGSQMARKERQELMVPTFADGGALRSNPLGYQTGMGHGRSDNMAGWFPEAGTYARFSPTEYILDAETTRNVGVSNLDLLRATKGASFGSMRKGMPVMASGGSLVPTSGGSGGNAPMTLELSVNIGLSEETFVQVINATIKDNNGSQQQLSAIVNSLNASGDNPLAHLLAKQIAPMLNNK